MNGYSDGKAEAWAFRWLKDGQQTYLVTLWCTDVRMHVTGSAVIDNFGNLVGVPS